LHVKSDFIVLIIVMKNYKNMDRY